MDDVSEDLKYLQKKYRRLCKTSDYYVKGGLFNRKMRQRLLGVLGQSGRDRKKYDFWQDVRDYVRSGLIDFQLFNDVSNKKDIDLVLNRESLKPVIRSLLFPDSIQEPAKDGDEKVKIAQLLVEIGLDYLGKKTRTLIPSITTRVENAIDLSKELSLILLSEEGKKSINWIGSA